MASVIKTVESCILNYPKLFPNALYVYNHLFCVVGNGYNWVNGELVTNDTSLRYTTVENAIMEYLNHALIEQWNEDGVAVRFLSSFGKANDDISKYIRHLNGYVVKDVETILNYKKLAEDFSIIENTYIGDGFNGFSFYPICEYSKIMQIPDDIKIDWLNAVYQMVDLMELHKDRIKDNFGFFDKCINEIKNKKINSWIRTKA